jgi:hypothetical protein
MTAGAAVGTGRLRLVVALIGSLLVSGVCNPPHDEYLESVNISHNVGRSADPACAVDSRGTVHLAWTDATPGLESGSGKDAVLYSHKTQAGAWTEPAIVSDVDRSSRFPTIAVGPDDRIHLAWQCLLPGPHWCILYSSKVGDSAWAVPETIVGADHYIFPHIAVDGFGVVHVLWEWGGYYVGFRYAERSPSGVWTPQEDLAPMGMPWGGRIATDPSGAVHFVYCYESRNQDTLDIYYRTKPRNGDWSSTVNISSSGRAEPSEPGVIADRAGNVYAAWRDLSLKLRCRKRDAAGAWDGTGGAVLCSLNMSWVPNCLTMGPSGEIYLPAYGPQDPDRGAYYLEYLKKPEGQPWSDTLVCGLVRNDPYGMAVECLACDNQGALYFIGAKPPPWPAENDIYTVEYEPKGR